MRAQRIWHALMKIGEFAVLGRRPDGNALLGLEGGEVLKTPHFPEVA